MRSTAEPLPSTESMRGPTPAALRVSQAPLAEHTWFLPQVAFEKQGVAQTAAIQAWPALQSDVTLHLVCVERHPIRAAARITSEALVIPSPFTARSRWAETRPSNRRG